MLRKDEKYSVIISDMNNEGNGVCRVDNTVVFVIGGVTGDGLRRTICSGRAVTDGFSWQPMQLTYSPGIPTVHDRISWTARPSASSGWMEMGRFTGASKNTLPSAVTGAVPSTYFMS